MEPLDIISKYYKPGSISYEFLVTHSEKVAEKALAVARRVEALKPDVDFIREASMLHDIGMFLTDAPQLGCYGDKPYITHGYLGRELLEKEGLPRHALVAERHVGAGLTIEDISRQALPLPLKDMTPQSLEEKIISFADKFYSKGKELKREKSVDEVRESMRKYGPAKLAVFDEWLRFFGYNS
jgi:uncharacterized protein